MRIISTLSTLLKSKALVAILAGVVIAGGATAVMAATPMGQNAVHSMNNTPKAAATTHPTSEPRQEDKQADKGKNDDGKGDKNGASNQATGCPALPAIQQLATEFGLSTAATSNSIKTICALHDGSFKGATTAGAAVSSTRVFGLGEIEGVLALAKSMATHNSNTNLTDANVQTLVAGVLQHCGSTSLMACVKADIPNFHSTIGNDTSGNSDNGDSGHHGKY